MYNMIVRCLLFNRSIQQHCLSVCGNDGNCSSFWRMVANAALGWKHHSKKCDRAHKKGKLKKGSTQRTPTRDTLQGCGDYLEIPKKKENKSILTIISDKAASVKILQEPLMAIVSLQYIWTSSLRRFPI